MAYVDPYDPTTPTDANAAAEGDDRIRELKRAISERLSTIIDGWPNTDPLTLKQAAVRAQESPETPQAPPVTVGTLAGRPNPPAEVGLLYYAQDTDQLFLAEDNAGVLGWDEIRQGVDQGPPVDEGTAAARPSPPAQLGLLYWSTDTEELHLSVDDAGTLVWKLIYAENATLNVSRADMKVVKLPVPDGLNLYKTFTESALAAGANIVREHTVVAGVPEDYYTLLMLRARLSVDAEAFQNHWLIGMVGTVTSPTASTLIRVEYNFLRTKVNATDNTKVDWVLNVTYYNGGTVAHDLTLALHCVMLLNA